MADRDSIYIELGRFKAGATGKFAITAFILIIGTLAATKAAGWW